MKIDSFEEEFTQYKTKGILSDHLKSIIIFFLYNKEKITDIIIAPAIFLLVVKKDGNFCYGTVNVKIGLPKNKFLDEPVFFGNFPLKKEKDN